MPSSPKPAAVPHPRDALFAGEKPFPAIPACEHFAGSEKLIAQGARAAGAARAGVRRRPATARTAPPPAGRREHAVMIAQMLAGPRQPARHGGSAHPRLHPPALAQDVDLLVAGAGARIAYLTLPKSTSVAQVAEMIDYIRGAAGKHRLERVIPVHVLVETHGALHDAWDIARAARRAGARLRAHGFRQRPPRRDELGEHALAGAVRASAGRARQDRGRGRGAGAWRGAGAQRVPRPATTRTACSRDAWRARNEFGFLRMWSIHPSQIRPIVDAMKPELGEVSRCRADPARRAARATGARSSTQGELHDRATYRYFWELLQKAKVTGVPIPQEADAAFFPEA